MTPIFLQHDLSVFLKQKFDLNCLILILIYFVVNVKEKPDDVKMTTHELEPRSSSPSHPGPVSSTGVYNTV